MTSRELSVAIKALKKQGIEYKKQRHSVPPDSSDFAIGIGMFWYQDLIQVHEHMKSMANRYIEAANDIQNGMIVSQTEQTGV
jgi:hypothetical protein